MRRVPTGLQMEAIDRAAIQTMHIPRLALMARAALAVADVAAQLCPPGARVVCLAGSGYNGGDGVEAARLLALRGYSVAYYAPLGASQPETEQFQAAAMACGVERLPDAQAFARALQGCALVIDALFGTGLSRAVTGQMAGLIQSVNASGRAVVAVDIPSGVSADNGHVLGAAVRAHHTVALQCAKVGHLLYPGRELAGVLHIRDIGIPGVLLEPTLCGWLGAQDAQRHPRSWDTHKGDYGHVGVLAGSLGMLGAGMLCAQATLRAGAGRCTWALPDSLVYSASAQSVECMLHPLPDASGGFAHDAVAGALAFLHDKQAAAMGPGLSRGAQAQAFARAVARAGTVPLVMDADALYALEDKPEQLAGRGNLICTPHTGEMARLLQKPVSAVQADPVGCAAQLAERAGAVVVLKGSTTVLCAPDGRLALSTQGNPGMATAGCGDVLCGVIAGLLAQGMDCFAAACAGVYLHGTAGDCAAARLGEAALTAGDVLRALPEAMRAVETHTLPSA